MSFTLNNTSNYPDAHPDLVLVEDEIGIRITSDDYLEYFWIVSGDAIMGLDPDEAKKVAEQTLEKLRELHAAWAKVIYGGAER